jgi:CRISPR-associated endonuclease Cas1
LEGRAGLAYFNAWQSLPLRWKGVGRHPIPHDWLTVGQRGSFARKKVENRNASHPVNTILNYAYAILESQVRIQVISAGYDPTIGILHTGRRGRPDFVLDLMEPLRPIVDRNVLELVQTHTFHPADFTIRSDGVSRINPEMAKNIVHFTGAENIASATSLIAKKHSMT